MNNYLEKLGLFAVGVGAGVLISQYYTKSPKILKWYLGKDNLPTETNWAAIVEKLSEQLSLDENNLAIATRAHTGHENIEEIYALLKSAHSRNPDNLVIAENFALVSISMSDVARDRNNLLKPEVYFQQARKIIEKIPENAISASTLLAIGYSLQKAFTFDRNSDLLLQARDAYKKAIVQDKKNKVLYCLLGECYMQQVNEEVTDNEGLVMDEAILSLKKAISLDESYGLAHFRLAEAYVRIGKNTLANEHRLKSHEIYSSRPSEFPKEFKDCDVDTLFQLRQENSFVASKN